MRALQLLNERAEQRAAYWRCTVCDEAFATGHEYRWAARPPLQHRACYPADETLSDTLGEDVRLAAVLAGLLTCGHPCVAP